MGLTGQVGHGLELLLPVLRDLDGLVLLVLGASGHPLLVGVGHHLLEVVRVHGVQDVEKVVPRRAFVLRVLGGEVHRDVWITDHLVI